MCELIIIIQDTYRNSLDLIVKQDLAKITDWGQFITYFRTFFYDSSEFKIGYTRIKNEIH